MYGWSAKEAMGRAIVEVTPSEEMVERAEEIMAEILAGRSWSGEFMVRRKDGSIFPALVTDTPVHDEQGNLVAIVGVSTDITEIKQTEELRRSEERFRLLAENAQDLIALYRLNPTPGFEYVSQSSTAITGYTPEEYYADPELAYKIVHPDDMHLLDETLQHPEAPSTIRWIRKDGRVIWTEQRNKPIYDEAGELVAIEGIARDITERVRADEELRESERRFSNVVSNANAYIYRCLNEPGYQNEFASHYALELTGYPPEDLLVDGEVRFGDLIVEEDRGRVWEEIQEALAENRSFGLRYAIHRRDGEIRHVQEYGQGIHDEYGEVVALEGLVYDVTELVRAEERLRESEERYRTLVERIPAIVYVQEPGEPSRTTYVSPQNEEILGYSPEECLADPDHWIKILHPDDRERVLAEDRRTNRSGSFFAMEYRQFARDGRVVWIRDEAALVRSAEGESLYWLGVQTDITERMQAEEERSLLVSLVESSQDAIFATTPDAIVASWNRSAERLYGYSAEEMIGQSVSILMPPDRLNRLAEAIENIKQGQSVGAEDTVQIKKDGGTVYTSVTISPIKDAQGNVIRASVIARDITERKALEEQLEHRAFHDSLTDLPNRHLFMDRLGQTLRRSRRPRKRKVAVLFMDLDNFKIVNDSLGHELGDKLLVAVVERLRGSLRPEDTLARFGGDEFTVLIEDVENPEDVVRVAERIVEDLREPFVIDERELFVRASTGIAMGDAHTKSSEELLRDADTAMYRAKADAVDYRMFDPEMYGRVLERLDLENDLRRALEKAEFTIRYQPKFRLGQTDRIEGVEALVRWEHPQRGFMLPDDFILVAEETGLIIPIGGWVMQEACRQAREWLERYPSGEPWSVCVNLSAAQVRHPGLLKEVSLALRESGLEPGSLTLEITEGTLLKDTAVIETVFGELKALGVRLIIDDFGREYSSLSYLNRLPVDGLKIDGSFMESLGQDPSSTTIVEAVISLAHSLGLEVTGEGVESAEQLENLRRMGCDLVQGHLFARPLPSEQVESLLEDQAVY